MSGLLSEPYGWYTNIRLYTNGGPMAQSYEKREVNKKYNNINSIIFIIKLLT